MAERRKYIRLMDIPGCLGMMMRLTSLDRFQAHGNWEMSAKGLSMNRPGITSLMICSLAVAHCASAAAGQFEDLGVPVKRALLMGSVIGPDKSSQKDLVYLNFMQNAGRLFLLVVDPQTGQARQYYSPQDSGGWATVLGPDKKVYLGTFGHGLILCSTREARGRTAHRRPSGKDGRVYLAACRRPKREALRLYLSPGKARFLRSGHRRLEDLGRMNETEMYARSLAAGADGRIYVSIGTVKNDLVMYDPATRQHRSAIPPQWSDVQGVQVEQGAESKVYAPCIAS